MKKARRFYNDPVDVARDKRYVDEFEKVRHHEIYEAEFDAMYEQDKKYFPEIYKGKGII